MDNKGIRYISDGNIHFSNSLYEILSRNDENVFYSPLSAHVILSLAYQGAAGETAKCLEKALHLSDTKVTAEGYKALMTRLTSVSNVKLHIANKVFVHEQYKIKEEFNSIAKEHYQSEAENINFAANVEAAKTINAWVEDKTNNKIQNIISPRDLNDLTRLVLVNAIYFKGEWLHKFAPRLTKKEKFYLTETDTVNCDMMHQTANFRYDENQELDAQILSMPYKNEILSLFVILPKAKTGIKDLEKKLLTKNLKELCQEVVSAEVNVSLPKFKIETTVELNDPLKELGLGVMFSNDAKFPHMLTSPEPIKVSKIVQKAFIEVNEEGSEAAAATAMMTMLGCSLGRPPQIHKFQADHPFIFVLAYNTAEVFIPLFVGKFLKP